jgi:hypothetical protein
LSRERAPISDAENVWLEVDGLPPAKSEALSMLGPGHPDGPRVATLLEAARDSISENDFAGFGKRLIGLEVVLYSAAEPRSDATNYLGGIGDVLESKGHRGNLEHLGDLVAVALYDNDRQIREVRFRPERSASDHYTVRLWPVQ